MKKLFLTILIIIPITIFSQEKISYRNAKNENINFQISRNSYFINYHGIIDENKIKSHVKEFIPVSKNKALIRIENNNRNYTENKKELQNKFVNKSISILPVLVYKDGIQQVCDEEIIIKTKNNYPLDVLLKGFKYNVTADKFVKAQYLIKLRDLNISQLFDLINKLQAIPNIEFVEPNFIRFLKPFTSDPYYSSQWAINNQGYLGGTLDADMDVDQAWALSTGQDIKIAIIDEGVDLTHPDLTPNLLLGYDATGHNSNGAPNENNNDAHGTACAGIVAAVANNNTGVAGIAYNSKIIPVRIAYSNGYPLGDYRRKWITDDTWISNGINWAVQNGADILSNSWGGGSPSTTITNAINNAVNNGRNGKGCVVLFAAGNKNSNVQYPAILTNVIAVGASSMCDERKSPSSCDGENWWGSNYGNEIDVIAPGVKIYTTDISGIKGFSYGNYKSDFNGTSSACPNTAGVAALILSLNPNFTQNEVREVLEKSADKPSSYNYSYHSNGSWNIEVGYGRINAFNSVKSVIYIAGSLTVCTSNSTFTLHNRPSGSTVLWTRSSNLTQVSGSTGTTYTVKAKNSSVSGQGWVKANVNGVIIPKTFWVGKPSQPTITGNLEIGCDYNFYYANPGSPYSYNNLQWSVTGPLRIRGSSIGTHCTIQGLRSGMGWIYFTTSNTCGSKRAELLVEVNCNGFKAYPNPTSNILTIELDNKEEINQDKLIEVKIYDKLMMLKKHKKFAGTKTTLNIKNLEPGVYILQVKIGDKISEKKIIVSDK